MKKEQLTKGQKRNAWRKGGLNEGDRERGWNWVDVIKWVSSSSVHTPPPPISSSSPTILFLPS